MAKKPKTKPDDDAAKGDAASGDAVAGKGKLPPKMIMIAGGGLAGLLAVVGLSLWMLGFFSPRNVEEARAPSVEAASQGQPGQRRPPHFLDIPEMTVNLSGGVQQGGRPSYLRIRVALELTDSGVASQIQPVMPRVQDTLQTFLRELRTSDLEGSAGVHRLREELGRRVNLIVQPARVEAVLFRELLVQ
jgi:flagellar protein FliL